jgi:alanyl aminopeptidase
VGSKVEYAFEPAWDNGFETGRSRNAALYADRLASARSIAAPVESRNAIDDAFDDITYNKGEEVLAMFEAWMGPARFRAAVREFLARHAYGTATSADFFQALGEARALETFVRQPGAPLLDVTLDCTGEPAIAVSQRRFRPKGSTAKELQWSLPACFRYGADGKEETKCAEISSKTRIPLPSCPSWIVANAGGRGHYLALYEPALLKRNLEQAASVPSKEAQVLARDTLLLVDAGLAGAQEGFRVAEAALAHPSPHVRLAGLSLLQGLRDDWLTAAEKRAKSQVVTRRVMPIARELGWEPRPADSDATQALRAAVMPFVADREEGASLRAPARAIALRWIANPDSADATMAKPVVEVAARFADARTFARFERAAVAARGTRERFLVLGALARARDPELRTRALSLSLAKPDGSTLLAGRETLQVLSGALKDDESRPAAFEYVIENVDALEAKLPRDSLPILLVSMGRACTSAERKALDAAFAPRASRYMTGALRLQQALESIDLCVAAHRG